MHVDDRETVVGVQVDLVTTAELQRRVIAAMCRGERLWVSNHNLHSAYLMLEDEDMRRWDRAADLVFVDGMSLVALSRLTGGRLQRSHRSTILDWMPGVLAAAAREGKVVFHLGGDPEWIERGAAVWREQHRGLKLHVHHGFFADADSGGVIAEIERVRPDLLLIGMGMPRQEQWAAEHAAALGVPVIVTVGAFLAYAAGASSKPPRWMGQVGLEWAWRLAADPRRLARRYLVEPVVLMRELRRRRRSSASPGRSSG